MKYIKEVESALLRIKSVERNQKLDFGRFYILRLWWKPRELLSVKWCRDESLFPAKIFSTLKWSATYGQTAVYRRISPAELVSRIVTVRAIFWKYESEITDE